MPKQALYFGCINPEIRYKIQVIVFHVMSSSLMVACTWQRLLEETQWNLIISFNSVVRVCIFMKRWPQLSWAPTSADVCETTGVIRTPEVQVVARSCPRDCNSHCPWCLSMVILLAISSVQFSPVAQSCLTLCDPMNRSTTGLPVHHQLPESTQTHVHWVDDAIQLSHPLSSPFPPALNLSQHQGLLKWVSSSHQVAKVLEFQLQHQSFQWTPRTDVL